MDRYRNIINFKEILYKNKGKHVTHKYKHEATQHKNKTSIKME